VWGEGRGLGKKFEAARTGRTSVKAKLNGNMILLLPTGLADGLGQKVVTLPQMRIRPLKWVPRSSGFRPEDSAFQPLRMRLLFIPCI
jgi:hypothetical protein